MQATEAERRLGDCKGLFDSERQRCLRAWFTWVAASKVTLLREHMDAQDWYHLPEHTMIWQEHEVAEESEAGLAVQSRIYLPSQASGYVLGVLCSVCAELNRAGNMLERGVMLELVAFMSSLVARCFEDTIVASQRPISQDGYVQLLFDFDFIMDVLSAVGSLPESDETRALTTRLDALRSRLREGIDPFDLVVYEKPLAEARARLYVRCEVLLGNFTRLNRIHVGTKAAISSSDRDNMVAVAPGVPRFPPLPVSTARKVAVKAPSESRLPSALLAPGSRATSFDQLLLRASAQ